MAAYHLPEFVPMIDTAIGTTKPTKVLVIGTGVVGLQAIATAPRLGGVVKAFDIREAARAEAESLGAKIAGFEVPQDLALGEVGYAKALPADWLEHEREALKPLVADADLVILGALVPGEVAPVLITEEMVASMRPGSVIVDVSVDQGGNCACTQAGKEVYVDGVLVSAVHQHPRLDAGARELAVRQEHARVRPEPLQERPRRAPDWDDEIVQNGLVTRGGKIVHDGTLDRHGRGLIASESERTAS